MTKLEAIRAAREHLRKLEDELCAELETLFPDWYWAHSADDVLGFERMALNFPGARTWRNPDRAITPERRAALIQLGFKQAYVSGGALDSTYLHLDECSSTDDDSAVASVGSNLESCT